MNHYVAAFSCIEEFNYRAKLELSGPVCSESVPMNVKGLH